MQIDISKLGYKWRGTFAEGTAYIKNDVTYKDGGTYRYDGISWVAMALGQQDFTEKTEIVAGESGVTGTYGQQLHVNGSGSVEFQFTKGRNNTSVASLPNNYDKGETGGLICYNHNMVIMNDGSVRSWGYEEYGMLGHGYTGNRSKSLPVAVAFPHDAPAMKTLYSGWKSSFTIDVDGQLWAWGQNNYGQLGCGNTSTQKVPVKISGMGDLPADDKVIKVSHGTGSDDYHCTTVLTDKGFTYWMGDNRYDCAGLHDNNDRNVPTIQPRSEEVVSRGKKIVNCWTWSHTYGATWLLDSDGVLYGQGETNTIGRMHNNENPNEPHLTYPPSLSKPVKCVRGDSRSYMIIYQDGDIDTWGDTAYSTRVPGSQTWTPTRDTRITNVVDGYCGGGAYNNHVVLKSDGTVWGIGYNGYNQLSATNGNHSYWQAFNNASYGNSKIVDIVKIIGFHRSHRGCGAGLTSDGKVIHWGTNSYGGAGIGTDTSSPGVSQFDYAKLPGKIVDMTMSGYLGDNYNYTQMMFLMEDGTVYICGYNGNAALGMDDDHEWIGVPTPVLL